MSTLDDDYGDWNLRLTSPATDAGDNKALPAGVVLDLAGNPRFVYIYIASVTNTGHCDPPIADTGAYEVQNIIYLPMIRK